MGEGGGLSPRIDLENRKVGADGAAPSNAPGGTTAVSSDFSTFRVPRASA